MDKLDEWMNRAFDGSDEQPSNSDRNQTAPQKGHVPHSGTHNKTVNNNQKPTGPQQRNSFSVQGSNKQQSRMNQNGQQNGRSPQGSQPHGQTPYRGSQGQSGQQSQQRPPQPLSTQQSASDFEDSPFAPIHADTRMPPRAPQRSQGQTQRRDNRPELRRSGDGSQRPQGGQRPAQAGQRPNGPRPAQASQRPATQQAARPAQGGRKVDYNKPGKPPKLPKAPHKQTAILKGKVKIIPLGGLNEVGKNMTAFEYEDDIIIVDMGLEFPSEDMFGIDYVIPDISYLEDNKKRIRGVVVTHGHLDHIGGIPYILPKLDFPPIFATNLTIGLIKKRIDEFKQDKLAKLNIINPDQTLKLGQFALSFFRVAHSIPDCVGIVIDTPVGKLVHTGDFKFDATPARNQAPADIHKMEALGSQNVLALFCESTNALKPGHSMSELDVGVCLTKIIKEAPARVIIASFSSQVGRIQQILDAAVACNRKVFVSGRSMSETMSIAASLGYLSFPKDLIYDIKKYKKIPDQQALILTTGSQGESVSALTRIANGEHPHVRVQKDDMIVLSSSPIIGNEQAISTVINKLSLLGAEVIHNQIMDVHTSGHGKQEELARMINYIKPKYLIPIHGEYYMRLGLSKVAQKYCGMKEHQILMAQNGNVIVAEPNKVQISAETVETKYILIDGLGEGHFDSQVQMDREIMSQNGALVVLVYVRGKALGRTPDVVSRGFIYLHESDEITKEISDLASEAYRRIMDKNPGANRQDIKKYIRQTVDKYTHTKIERRPLIIPLIIET
ncbi:MAG: RNase J family beta-CASP ribonuclease [Candidatus Peregrinibacteria bacterium]|nr:RNase J family beta-CASP ribonuclease [Candidatus Peregrinibacteria bacterium]